MRAVECDDGVLIFDDTIQEKAWTSIPVAFELVKKPIQYSCLTTKKLKRQSEKTKNEMMRFTENYASMHLAAPTPSFSCSARLRNISQ